MFTLGTSGYKKKGCGRVFPQSQGVVQTASGGKECAGSWDVEGLRWEHESLGLRLALFEGSWKLSLVA